MISRLKGPYRIDLKNDEKIKGNLIVTGGYWWVFEGGIQMRLWDFFALFV